MSGPGSCLPASPCCECSTAEALAAHWASIPALQSLVDAEDPTVFGTEGFVQGNPGHYVILFDRGDGNLDEFSGGETGTQLYRMRVVGTKAQRDAVLAAMYDPTNRFDYFRCETSEGRIKGMSVGRPMRSFTGEPDSLYQAFVNLTVRYEANRSCTNV